MSSDALALLFVSYGSGDEIAKALASAARGSRQPERVLIADNLCDGKLADQLAEFKSNVEIVDCPDNPGYGGAINRLVARLEPNSVKWLLIVNPDIEFEPGAIAELLAAGADAGIGAVGPKVLDENGHVYPSARRIPSIRTGVGHAVFGRVWPANPWTRRYFDLQTGDETRSAGWLSGACVLVHARAFADVGGFDEAYFMYFEDVDLGFRLGNAGWRSIYAPAAVVHHEGGHSTRESSALMRAAHHKSAELFLKRRYPGVLLAPVRFVLSLGLRLRERFGSQQLG